MISKKINERQLERIAGWIACRVDDRYFDEGYNIPNIDSEPIFEIMKKHNLQVDDNLKLDDEQKDKVFDLIYDYINQTLAQHGASPLPEDFIWYVTDRYDEITELSIERAQKTIGEIEQYQSLEWSANFVKYCYEDKDKQLDGVTGTDIDAFLDKFQPEYGQVIHRIFEQHQSFHEICKELDIHSIELHQLVIHMKIKYTGRHFYAPMSKMRI